jgi:hypothetical protein
VTMQDLTGKIGVCSDGMVGLIHGTATLPWGESYVGVKLIDGTPWASRAPYIVADSLAEMIKKCFTREMLKAGYSGENNRGYCYIASEAYHHLSDEDTKPYVIKHEGVTHWFLKDANGRVIDLTPEQFATIVPYDQARQCPFLTGLPSKRCRMLIQKIQDKGAHEALRSHGGVE